MTRPPSRRAAPRVERLEDRNLLDCSATFAQGVITIRGTPGADSVFINDLGNQPGSFVQVTCNGVPHLTVSGAAVRAIRFSTGAGNDSVVYQLNDSLSRGAGGASRTIGGDLGAGNDSFSASINAGLDSGSLRIRVSGGAGNDSITTSVNDDLSLAASLVVGLFGGQGNDMINCTSSANVAAGCRMSMKAFGMQGDDHVTMNGGGDIDGQFQFGGNGGQGQDQMQGQFMMAPNSGMTPSGPCTPACEPVVQMCGGSGHNQMSMSFQSQSQSQSSFQSTVVLVGGLSDVISTHGSNVKVTIIR